jgi:hypothetical protein
VDLALEEVTCTEAEAEAATAVELPEAGVAASVVCGTSAEAATTTALGGGRALSLKCAVGGSDRPPALSACLSRTPHLASLRRPRALPRSVTSLTLSESITCVF